MFQQARLEGQQASQASFKICVHFDFQQDVHKHCLASWMRIKQAHNEWQLIT